METRKGFVEHIIYKNPLNGYGVINLMSDEEEITCTGIFTHLDEGECIEVNGDYVEHAVYGTQFKVEKYRVVPPEDSVAIERYLGSGAIRGVGAALAARIVKRFGDDTFRIIEEEPERLVEIKGISERIAREIAEQVEEKRDIREAMIFLQKYGISNAFALKTTSAPNGLLISFPSQPDEAKLESMRSRTSVNPSERMELMPSLMAVIF